MSHYLNSVKSLTAELTDLNSLHRIVEERSNYISDNPDKNLHMFIIDGKIVLTPDGKITFIIKCAKSNNSDTTIDLSDYIQGVITFSAYQRLINKLEITLVEVLPYNISIIPFNNTICPHCKKGWLLDMLPDYDVITTEFPAQDISNHIGSITRKKVADNLTKLRLSLGIDNVYYNEEHASKRNEVIINTLNLETNAVWTLKCENNKIVSYCRHDVYHKNCYEFIQHVNLGNTFNDVFVKAGIKVFGYIRTINNFVKQSDIPWFIFDTDYGSIVIGYYGEDIMVNYVLAFDAGLTDEEISPYETYHKVDTLDSLHKSLLKFMSVKNLLKPKRPIESVIQFVEFK